MSRLLRINLEDFDLNQDITKTIQPYKPFCICCLDREVQMFDLEKCSHAEYLDGFFRPQFNQFKQLVCTRCHSMLKQIQRFRAQVLESSELLMSGAFTDNTINTNKVNNLMIQTVVNDLNLLHQDTTEQILAQKELETSTADGNIVQGPLTHINVDDNINDELQNDSNMEQNFVEEIQNNLNLEQNFTDEFQNESDSLKMEHNFVDEIEITSNLEPDFQNEPIVEQDFTNDSQNNTNVEQNILNEDQMSHTQNRLNKNIKTALEILERNNQSFVGLSSQLQFLNGEHLSFLETSLLSKEILTDIPLVPKTTSTDFGNELINNVKTLDIEIDGTDTIFYDSLGLSPELDEKEAVKSEITLIIDTEEDLLSDFLQNSSETKPKKKKDRQIQVRRVKLSHEELVRERVALAQAHTYTHCRFRCETCIVGFNFKENLDDHKKRKHGPIVGECVQCEICTQTIPSAGHAAQHYYTHYTRYECLRCHKKYQSLDEALHHCRQCGNAASSRYKVNKPRMRRRMFKLKQSSAES